MRYISIDIETTGLEEIHDIVEIGIVADSLEGDVEGSPEHLFHAYVRPHHDPWPLAHPTALKMHRASGLYDRWHKAVPLRGALRANTREVAVPTHELAQTVSTWLYLVGLLDPEGGSKVNVAGKNIATFDWPTLCRLVPGWASMIPARRRMLDPGILYMRPHEDAEVPDLTTCLQRASLPSTVSHNALDDAMQVVNLLRSKYRQPILTLPTA